MVLASPESAEPIRKMTIEASKNVLRPYRSPSLPHSGVDTVDASRYAVTTQDRCDSPCRSPAIVGSAVATIVWSSAASSSPSSSAPMMMSLRRCPICSGSASAAAGEVTVLSSTQYLPPSLPAGQPPVQAHATEPHRASGLTLDAFLR